jgi:hypothetical protein
MTSATKDTRFSDLEEPLREAVAWAGILDRLIEDNIAKGTVSPDDEEIILVHVQLQAAIERIDAIFHGREPLEGEAAAWRSPAPARRAAFGPP